MGEAWSDNDEDVERRIQSHMCSIRIALDRDGLHGSDRTWIEQKLREIVEGDESPIAKVLAEDLNGQRGSKVVAGRLPELGREGER